MGTYKAQKERSDNDRERGMKRKNWSKRIKNACEAAGTYRAFFDPVIDSLAGIMELRDNALEKYEASGANTIVKYTNKSGNTNIVKNPALVVLMECEAQALTFWRELGLTPSGLRKINENGLTVKTGSGGKTMLDIVRTQYGKNK